MTGPTATKCQTRLSWDEVDDISLNSFRLFQTGSVEMCVEILKNI